MKKTFLAIFLPLLLVAQTALADSYTSLWKQAQTAQEKGHPQTQLKALESIARKAQAERAYGHLLKAQLQAMLVQNDVSPDSLPGAVARLKQTALKAEKNDSVLAAVYHSVVGTAYSRLGYSLSDSSEVIAKQYYDRSLSHPDLLAKTYTTAYEPFVEDGIDSRIFGDDMLHVLGMEAGNYRLLHDYYSAHGNRSAACYCALQLLSGASGEKVVTVKKSRYIQSLDSLLSIYRDLNEAGEVAIARYNVMEMAEDISAEDKMNFLNYALTHWGAWPRMNVLRNAQRRLTLPSFHVLLGDEVLIPNTPRKVVAMEVCNISELTMTVRRLNASGDISLNPAIEKDYAKIKKLFTADLPYTQTHRFVGLPAYKVVRDTLEIKGLPVGVYLVEFSTNNVSVPVERTLLRVSNLLPVYEKLPGSKTRMAVVDATTGLPVPGANVRLTVYDRYSENKAIKELVCDSVGELLLDNKYTDFAQYYIYTEADKAFLPSYFYGAFSAVSPARDQKQHVNLYTDRSIYRPGQTVQVAALAYNIYANKDTEAAAGVKLTLTLRDANYKEVGRQELTTDEYGVASASFVLPSTGLTGRYSVQCNSGRYGSAIISVEEYKRPTFQVEFDKQTAVYHSGDTVSVKGTAKSFAGVPVQGARVICKVTRRPSMLRWWRGVEASTQQILTDTLHTDGQGAFTLRVPMELPETAEEHPSRFFSFDIVAEVTDGAGETRQGQTSLPLSDHPTLLTCDVPEKIERDSLKTITFYFKNNAGENIDTTLVYHIDGQRFDGQTNVPLPLPTLASRQHELEAVCGSDTLRTKFVTFTADDERTVVDTHDWFYASAEQFPSDGGRVFVQVGLSDSVQHVFYTIVTGENELLESGSLDLTDGRLSTRWLTYDEAYGDGLVLTCAWVKEGQTYTHRCFIRRPERDRRLLMKWSTFRDRLTPGQKEEWRLTITRPDGTPAKAELMATLFDKSLDEIRLHGWSFYPSIYTQLPFLSWSMFSSNTITCYGEMPMRSLRERLLVFSHYDFPISFSRDEICYGGVLLQRHSERKQMAYAVPAAADVLNSVTEDVAESKTVMARKAEVPALGSTDAGDGETEAATTANINNVAVRENLNETAFFYPSLTTDADGNVSMKFTLPESITTWRFIGFAHDTEMNHGMLEAEAVAKKTVMVQPNVPRFVRSADKGQLVARLFNTSDKKVSGTARLSFLNPETNKEVFHKDVRYTIQPQQSTTATFDFDMSRISQDGLLICRVVATGSGYSDGEQHYLPVLSDRELVTNTLPLAFDGAGQKTVDLTTLFPVKDKANKLTLEYTSHPQWMLVQALPSLAVPDGDNAISLAAAYYANSLGAHLMKTTPAIKQAVALWRQEADGGTSLLSSLQKDEELKSLLLSETPWVLDADRETDQKRQLVSFFDESALQYKLQTCMTKLRQLQNPDGSFSWWKGMSGSVYVTLSVAEMMARLEHMTGQQSDANSVLKASCTYLEKTIAKEVDNLKRAEKKGEKDLMPSQTAVDYLYLRSLSNPATSAKAKADNAYLIGLMKKHPTAATIYGKALTAIVFNANGEKQTAADVAQSLREYTVYKEEMGRYYDTPRATYSWCDYRIPAQVASIEALKAVTPDDTKTISEMQRWLLQSKRTQAWSTPINSVNAVYAFMDGNASQFVSTESNRPTVKLNGSVLTLPTATSALGYVKTSTTGKDFRTLTIEKQDDGTSWGAVYAQFYQPTTEVSAASAGLQLQRELYKDGRRLTSEEMAALHVGDKITVRITLVADRDYDFVQVSDRRAACMEPAQQLSGYRWGYFCAPKDNMTNYFFDRLSKGKHTIETTYYIDRSGRYGSGTCTAQCAYSPEYSARVGAFTVNVQTNE